MTDEVATSREWAGDVRCRALILPASAIRSPNSARRSLFCERPRAQSTHSAGRCDPRTYKVVMGDSHEIRLLLYRGVQEPARAVLPALKPSGYCTTITCPCPSRLLKKAHLPRWRARAALRRTRKYASRLHPSYGWVPGAPPCIRTFLSSLGVNEFFSILLGRRGAFSGSCGPGRALSAAHGRR